MILSFVADVYKILPALFPMVVLVLLQMRFVNRFWSAFSMAPEKDVLIV
jgi:hypothetical protein